MTTTNLTRPRGELRQTPLAACLALAMGLAGVAPAALADVTGGGNTLVVANCDDSGSGSLRSALGSAVSGDTVDLSQLTCSNITLDTALIADADYLTLKGAPSSKYGTPAIGRAPSNTQGLLRHTGSGLLTIEDLTLVNGTRVVNGFAAGGCVYSNGSVHLLHSAAKYCVAESTGTSTAALGGAITASDDVMLTGSLVTSSKTETQGGNSKGGGIYAGGNLYSKYSAIRDNSALTVSGISQAGGVWADAGTIDNSTISGNEAGFIGGLRLGPSSQSVKIENSTISGNTSTGSNAPTAGAWISVDSNNVVLENNTITANVNHNNQSAGLNLAGDPSSVVLTSNIISGNRYYIGEFSGEPKYSPSDLGQSTSVTITGSHNLVGHIGSNVILPGDTIQQEEAPFGPLDAGGGFIGTHAIGTGSWAFNLGTTVDNGTFDPPETEDQRGEDRNVGTGVDIGAVESDALFLGRFEDPPTF